MVTECKLTHYLFYLHGIYVSITSCHAWIGFLQILCHFSHSFEKENSLGEVF